MCDKSIIFELTKSIDNPLNQDGTLNLPIGCLKCCNGIKQSCIDILTTQLKERDRRINFIRKLQDKPDIEIVNTF